MTTLWQYCPNSVPIPMARLPNTVPSCRCSANVLPHKMLTPIVIVGKPDNQTTSHYILTTWADTHTHKDWDTTRQHYDKDAHVIVAPHYGNHTLPMIGIHQNWFKDITPPWCILQWVTLCVLALVEFHANHAWHAPMCGIKCAWFADWGVSAAYAMSLCLCDYLVLGGWVVWFVLYWVGGLCVPLLQQYCHDTATRLSVM